MLTNSIILFRNRIVVAHQQEATTELKHYCSNIYVAHQKSENIFINK